MKILHVNVTDIVGGASRAAYRIHSALCDAGVDSRMLVYRKYGNDSNVLGNHSLIQSFFINVRSVLDKLPYYTYRYRTGYSFSPSRLPFSGVVSRINALKPDIVHLHWINRSMIRIEDLLKINAPIVWSLHDMWAFTGGCHYTEGCEGFKKECGNCKVLGSSKPYDLSSRIYDRKRKTYNKLNNVIFAGTSKWIASEASASSLLIKKDVLNIPSSIDAKTFKPIDKKGARHVLGLPEAKHLVFFGAMDATSNERKGFKELRSALLKLPTPHTDLVVFGAGKPKAPQGFKQKAHYLGQVQGEEKLCSLYNAADVMVVPSLQENLSNVIMESLSCGTPVVAFDIGGNGDMIDHKVNGYLAKPFDIDDLSNGIKWVLEHPQPEVLCKSAREKVLQFFDYGVVAKRYLELYEGILGC